MEKSNADFEKIIQDKKINFGLVIYKFSTQELLFQHQGNVFFPMQSVFKFPVALVVLDRLDKNKECLTEKISLTKEKLLPNTYSPIREKYPDGVNISLGELISYTVARSDNNGCDVLLARVGGPLKVESYFRDHNINDIDIKFTEEDMHADKNKQFENKCTPLAMLDILKKFYEKKLLSLTSTSFLWHILQESNTGTINKLLPSEVKIGYKTGFSGVDPQGIISAQNCVGIMEYKGEAFAFALFITNSKETYETNNEIIAKIGQWIFLTYLVQ